MDLAGVLRNDGTTDCLGRRRHRGTHPGGRGADPGDVEVHEVPRMEAG